MNEKEKGRRKTTPPPLALVFDTRWARVIDAQPFYVVDLRNLALSNFGNEIS